MLDGMKRPKHPPHADISQLGKSIVDASTSETDDPPESAAVIRGRKGGVKGGKARAGTLSSERRSEIAKKAARSRWKKAT
jgi:hypothetical protein